MATTTTNFGWDIPQSTDLVKDGATAIAALGQDIDTALVDLKGGTTGQILAKASNTDLDYSWITNDVGDITAVTAGTGITGGGTSGAVTVSFDQANFGGGQFAAGKNGVLNSNMAIAQRGTSVAVTAGVTTAYTLDRWLSFRSVAGATVSRQLTNDNTNLPNIQYCARVQRDSGNTSTAGIWFSNSFETVNSEQYAGKTVVLSFYARAGANFSAASNALSVRIYQGQGTDQNIVSGYTSLNIPLDVTSTLTTTWQRFTTTATALLSTTTEVGLRFYYDPVGTAGANDYYEITGVQLEQANTASPYAPNGATYQAELAACQRYYTRVTPGIVSAQFNQGFAKNTTEFFGYMPLPVQMRVVPTASDTSATFSKYQLTDGVTTTAASNLLLIAGQSTQVGAFVYATVASGLTAFRPYSLQTSGTGSDAYIGFTAEL